MANQRIWGTLDPFFESGAIVGRRVANADFLRHLLEADPFSEYHFFLDAPGQIRGLKKALKLEASEEARAKCRIFPRSELPGLLGKTSYHCFHQSDCIFLPHHVAALRNRYSKELFPITGATHSLSYAVYPAAFLHHMWTGTTARDCVVATSQTGQGVVQGFYAMLRENYGLDPTRFPAPRVELIPLGVREDMAPVGPDEREALRKEFNVGQDQVMILVFGRLHHASKMDYLAVFRALNRCFQDGLDHGKVRLAMAGWGDDEEPFLAKVQGLAKAMGLQLSVHLRPNEARKRRLFQAADIFVSPSDNPQETFGLTLLEAAASGLPVVASDYDGYKDLVRHGETGYLIPTVGPAHTEPIDIMAPLQPENRYHLLLAQQTAVEVKGLAQSLAELIADPGKRTAMGEAGRDMARAFAWPRIIDKWVELWERLWQEPIPNEDGVRQAEHPLTMPFGRIFGAYPTSTLTPEVILVWSRSGEALYRGQESPIIYQGLEGLVDVEQLKTLVFLARKPRSVGEMTEQLMEAYPDMGTDKGKFLVNWALKHDFLEQA